MSGMRILCPNCNAGTTGQDVGVRMSDGSRGTVTVLMNCKDCGGTGWITHPGKWKSIGGGKQ